MLDSTQGSSYGLEVDTGDGEGWVLTYGWFDADKADDPGRERIYRTKAHVEERGDKARVVRRDTRITVLGDFDG